jgi:hypothetical protein
LHLIASRRLYGHGIGWLDAHLIATAEWLPQTREKRRLEPEAASRLYGAAQATTQLRRVRLASL